MCGESRTHGFGWEGCCSNAHLDPNPIHYHPTSNSDRLTSNEYGAEFHHRWGFQELVFEYYNAVVC
ncbi:hypothetical protein GXM_09269 [Nostoc sphaeroides CCNUC1]|uniref:Uncharacterized protein n=1 Tax=Nostoc sphaeroides CCNUC1 TaxID=2653204 RepID=A0A5P8WG08_9NOSO|nr:hypothetical protein GXM_09269 [Nostoc sphaeroides CCNUC1]